VMSPVRISGGIGEAGYGSPRMQRSALLELLLRPSEVPFGTTLAPRAGRWRGRGIGGPRHARWLQRSLERLLPGSWAREMQLRVRQVQGLVAGLAVLAVLAAAGELAPGLVAGLVVGLAPAVGPAVEPAVGLFVGLLAVVVVMPAVGLAVAGELVPGLVAELVVGLAVELVVEPGAEPVAGLAVVVMPGSVAEPGAVVKVRR
jgi:hypothetical protein